MTLDHIEILSLHLIAIALLVTLIVSFIFTWQSRQYKASAEYLNIQSDENFYLILERLALINFCSIIAYGVMQVTEHFWSYTGNETIGILYSISVAVVSFTALVFYIFRLKYAFTNTIYEISDRKIQMFVIFTCIAGVIILFGMHLRQYPIKSLWDGTGWTLFVISWILFVLEYMYIASIFCKNLFQLVLLQIHMTSKSNPHRNTINSKKKQKQKQKQKQKFQMTKIKIKVKVKVDNEIKSHDQTLTPPSQDNNNSEKNTSYDSENYSPDNENENENENSPKNESKSPKNELLASKDDDGKKVKLEFSKRSEDLDESNKSDDIGDSHRQSAFAAMRMVTSFSNRQLKSHLTYNQLQLIDNITKQTTLIAVASICGVLFAIFAVLFVVIPDSLFVQFMYYFCRMLITCSFPITLWLSFVFAKREYTYCCRCCHKWNENCCIKVVAYCGDLVDENATQTK